MPQIPTFKQLALLIIWANVIGEMGCKHAENGLKKRLEFSGSAEFSIRELPIKMGKTPIGMPKYFWLSYRNTGSNWLVIDSMSAPCSCTSGILHKRPLMPGQQDSMKIIFHPGGNVGRYEGEFTLYIRHHIKPVLIPFVIDIY